MRQFHAKLTALGLSWLRDIRPSDESAFRGLVAWLEEQRIRHYAAADRAKLLDVNAAAWPEALRTYLADIRCPLLGTEAENDRGSFGDTFKQAADSTAAAVRNPLDRLDFEADDFKRGVQELATLLKVPHHPDHKEVLKACCLLIAQRLSPESISRARDEAGKKKIRLDEVPIGFDTAPGSRAGAELARILRLLYLADLRTLQTQINHAIVQVQAITADPED
uniref:Type VI secretion system protein TssA n=1 Tax=Macrostomum lignano TaxID=282301 RepID=A0A1I8F8K6_9PLAT